MRVFGFSFSGVQKFDEVKSKKMKKSINIFLLTLGFLPILIAQNSTTRLWTEKDRQFLLEELNSTQSELINEIENLNQEQFAFKPDSSKWSIAEVVEHIGVYEELLYWDLLNNQYTDERPDLVDSVRGIDSIMLAYATDPNKGIAPFIVQPIGRFKEKNDLLNFFNRYREAVMELIRLTSADFRLHFVYRPADWGVWHIRDLHQYTLVWIAHTERHINQIKTIKMNSNFPKH